MIRLDLDEVVRIKKEQTFITAIKYVREQTYLPLVTAKCLVETLVILDSMNYCTQCNRSDLEDVEQVPYTIKNMQDRLTEFNSK